MEINAASPTEPLLQIQTGYHSFTIYPRMAVYDRRTCPLFVCADRRSTYKQTDWRLYLETSNLGDSLHGSGVDLA
jgi:hypothetical protein